MKTTILSALLVVIPGTAALSTEYKTDRALRIEIETDMKLEMTTMEVERDGERQEGMGGGMSSHASRKEVHVDTVLEAKEGRPTKVRRVFEAVGGRTESVFGENSRETDLESPLEGVTIEIVRKDDENEASAVEGGSPDEKSLEGHRTDLFLDALLPEGDVKVDDTWELDAEKIRRAMRLDLSAALFPPPAPPEGGGEEGGGRRRGMRGGSDARLLTTAEWKGTAKLVSMDHDVDGTACAEIELKLEASGELPEPERGGGRGERMFSPEVVLPAAATTYQIDLEGKFHFAVKERRPVSLDLEGSAKVERDSEMKREESTIRIHSIQEGSVKFLVKVTEEAASEEK
ncbi:MAG: hypothetical protein ACKVXR_02860 [Planctomycetota bacterium]